MQKKTKKARSKELKAKRFLLSAVLPASLSLSSLLAQENINATGSNASGIGGSASYTLGQVVYTNNTGTNGSVAQGVQQPYEISVVVSMEEAQGITLKVKAYPNPTIDYLTIDVKDCELSNLHFNLYDMNGKILQSEKISGNQASILMSNLVPANYLVKVFQENNEVKTFQIIKK